jgi:integrase
MQWLLAHIAACDPVFHVFVVLAAITGARRAQLLALRWDDVNLATMRVAFRSGWVEGPDGPTLAATKFKRAHKRRPRSRHVSGAR